MQFTVVNKEAEALAKQNGMEVVMGGFVCVNVSVSVSEFALTIPFISHLSSFPDRCPKVEYSRLCGDLGLHGFSTQVLKYS